MGFSPLATTSLLITTSSISSCEGNSYIISSIVSSITARKPLAPVFRSSAFSAIALIAFSVNFNLIFSNSNSFLYCFTKAFFGSVITFISASISSSLSVATAENRPTNSGIKPYLSRSSGWIFSRKSSSSSSIFETIFCSNPRLFLPIRLRTISLRPTNAPPHTNNILVVSTCKNS